MGKGNRYPIKRRAHHDAVGHSAGFAAADWRAPPIVPATLGPSGSARHRSLLDGGNAHVGDPNPVPGPGRGNLCLQPGRLACALRYRAGAGSAVGNDGSAYVSACLCGPGIRKRPAGRRERIAFPCPVSVAGIRTEWGVSDRGRFQPVRVLRGVAPRFLRVGAAWLRKRKNPDCTTW